MKAICITPEKGIRLEETPQPEKAAPGHLLIKMTASAINPGDKAFITRPLPPGSVKSLYNIYGASGAGTVIEAGEGVPAAYINSKVTIYRSLHYSDKMVGACIITPYSFIRQIQTRNGRLTRNNCYF
jgi:NADPH:quinone reductase